ncbi:MAG TPA: alkaline phosphatase D family protein [Candidatus Binatia bacterium]
MTRREFLKLLGNAGWALPSLSMPLSCAPALRAPDPATGLSLGYVAGDVTENAAVVWVRAEPGSNVVLHYGLDPSLGDFAVIGPQLVDPEADYSARFHLQKLLPASVCYYRAAVIGKAPGPIARFVTAPGADDDKSVVFCFSADTRESYRPFSVMDAVRAQRPDFFLHLGDTIYADRNGTATSLPEFWAKYRNNRDDAATQALHSETSVYVTWDDHEVADNYLPGHPLAPIGYKAFLDYWPIRRDPLAPNRIYRSFRWGKALELFILDVRQYRDRALRTMLGNAQKSWLLNGIAKSSAIFKFIATPVTMDGGGSDRWDGYAKERAEILRFINGRKIPGVVFLSADLHYAAITRIRRGGGLRDIAAGPLGGPLNRITDGSVSRFEFFSAENFNFAKITVDPKAAPAHALVEFIDQDNQTFHRAKINAG